jgi:hypothetical protein
VEVEIEQAAPAVWPILEQQHDGSEVVAVDPGTAVTVQRRLRLGVRVERVETVEAVDEGRCRVRVEVAHHPGLARRLFRRHARAEEQDRAAEVKAKAERARHL